MLSLALAPLSVLFAVAVSVRRALYRTRVLRAHRLRVPVVVVGNVTAGGSGKTPLVAALARALARRGFAPGIVSRGYGRDDEARVALVTPKGDANEVGDEALVLARDGWPVAVGADRAAAARALLDANPRCDVVLCDDGLQHYALARDVEIAVIDAARGLGNGRLMPSGPLREPRSRLAGVDAIVANGGSPREGSPPTFAMTLVPTAFRRVGAPGEQPIAALRGTRVHALAGIGNPERFFAQLASLGIGVDAHPFADHHRFVASDLSFADAAPVVMTEKDAVKCEPFASERCWYLRVEASVDAALVDRVVEKLRGSQAA